AASTTAQPVFTPLNRMQFLRVSLTIGVVPTAVRRMPSGAVTFVLVIVRLRSVPPPPTEPSTVTRLAPFSRMSASEASEPDTTRGPPLGCIVTVNGDGNAL